MNGIRIEDLELTCRTYHLLKREGVHTLDDLREFIKLDLSSIRNFGRQSKEEINNLLERIKDEKKPN